MLITPRFISESILPSPCSAYILTYFLIFKILFLTISIQCHFRRLVNIAIDLYFHEQNFYSASQVFRSN